MEKIKIAVVDDSAFMRKLISDMINEDNRFEVIAKLRNGKELIDNIEKLKPDLITLDIEMPVLDGLATLKELKKINSNVPVIMVSSVTKEGSKMTIKCLENGAVDFIAKPSGSISLDIEKIKEELIEKMLEITKVNKERKVRKVVTTTAVTESKHINKRHNVKVVVIGASTGGPKAIQAVLTKIDKNINVPILVVQHMPKGFTKAFAERLDKICQLQVVEAKENMEIKNNIVYIAEAGHHMEIGKDKKIVFTEEPPIWGVRPAVDYLFKSAAEVYKDGTLSAVLTGMGKDGAEGTAMIKDKGGLTIAQDEASCTIYGMPKAAFQTGKVDLVLSLDKVGETICKIVKGL